MARAYMYEFNWTDRWNDKKIAHKSCIFSDGGVYLWNKKKYIIYRTAMQKSIGIGQKVLYINGKKHIHTQDKKNGSKYIVQKKDLIILSKNKKTY